MVGLKVDGLWSFLTRCLNKVGFTEVETYAYEQPIGPVLIATRSEKLE